MSKCIPKIIIGIIITVATSNALGLNLLEAFFFAVQSDPTFRAAEAQYLATRETFPISQANLLPTVLFNASMARQYVNGGQQVSIGGIANLAIGTNTFYNTATTYSITATQPIFNYSNWMAVRNAIAIVKQAEATYFAAAQNLMFRVSNAYFNVLQAYDNLKTVQAQKDALKKQLEQTEQQFKVGLIAITGVEQTKASYDAAVAQEIQAKVNVSDRLEELSAITGVMCKTISGLRRTVPLVKPFPANINKWTEVAMRQNYTLLSSNFSVLAARENIKEIAGQHLPEVNATAGYAYTGNSNFSGGGNAQHQSVASVGLTASMPVYTGGLISAETRQASYQYIQAGQNREFTFRSILTQTREAYLGVISGVSRVQADIQSVLSNAIALQATQASYTVGTQTVVDVLVQLSNLINARLTLTTDQYAYLLNTLSLKQAAGTLSQEDLASINCWLGKQIDVSSFDPAVVYSQLTFSTIPLSKQVYPASATTYLPPTIPATLTPAIPAPTSAPAPITPMTTPTITPSSDMAPAPDLTGPNLIPPPQSNPSPQPISELEPDHQQLPAPDFQQLTTQMANNQKILKKIYAVLQPALTVLTSF